MMLTSIPASMIMGKYGRKFGSILVYAIFQHNFYWYCLGSFLIGIFNGFASFYRFAAVEFVDEVNKAKAISYVLVGGVIAAFIGPNLSSFGRDMFTEKEFVGGFVYATIMYVCVFFILTMIKFPKIVAVICGMLGYGVMTYVMTATPLAMGHHHDLDDTAFVIQWHVLAMFAPSFFTGTIIQRVGVINVLLLGALLALICMIINLNGYSINHFWLALFARKEETAKSQALNDFMVFSMVTLASLSSGFIQNNFGWQFINYSGIVFVFIIAVSLAWLIKTPNEKRLL